MTLFHWSPFIGRSARRFAGEEKRHERAPLASRPPAMPSRRKGHTLAAGAGSSPPHRLPSSRSSPAPAVLKGSGGPVKSSGKDSEKAVKGNETQSPLNQNILLSRLSSLVFRLSSLISTPVLFLSSSLLVSPRLSAR